MRKNKNYATSCDLLDTHQARAIAVAAFCDPRSVVAYLNGARIRGPLARRIEAALVAAGRRDLIRLPTTKAVAA